MRATALLAELQPATAAERTGRADDRHPTNGHDLPGHITAEGQTVEGVDRNVNRATKLMRLFNEQLDSMAKLKGQAVSNVWSSNTSLWQPARRRSSGRSARGEGGGRVATNQG